jgi:hypothetical protein
MDQIAFKIEQADWVPVNSWPMAIVLVNGEDVLADVEGMAMAPEDLATELRRPDAQRDATVRRCGCGEVGCGDLQVRVIQRDDTVVWNRWTGSLVSPEPLPEFRFEASQYAAAVKDLTDHATQLPQSGWHQLPSATTLGERALLSPPSPPVHSDDSGPGGNPPDGSGSEIFAGVVGPPVGPGALTVGIVVADRGCGSGR